VQDSRLKHAVAVGRLGSFSRAADAVGVTQSAVTKSVADLERHLGYALFHRTSRGTIPTEAGRDFIDRATRLLADTAELMGEGGRNVDPYRGALRIGVFPGSLEWMLTEPLTAVLKHHPSIRYDIVSGTSERGVQLLARGDIDVAFGMHAAFSSWAQFKCEEIGRLEAVPFVRRDHPILSMGRTRLETLLQFDFIMPSSSEPYTSFIQHI
jgi:DNA-binding transcriptional LysR family regulator